MSRLQFTLYELLREVDLPSDISRKCFVEFLCPDPKYLKKGLKSSLKDFKTFKKYVVSQIRQFSFKRMTIIQSPKAPFPYTTSKSKKAKKAKRNESNG